MLADNDGGVLTTGDAYANAPLYALHAMDMERLSLVRQVTVSYNNAEFSGKRVQHSLAIVQHMRVDVSNLVLTDTLGFQVEVHGFTAQLIKPNGEKLPLCAASASCASYQVKPRRFLTQTHSPYVSSSR